MKSSRKFLMGVMFLLAVTLVLSGCGQDKGDALVRVQKAGEISFAMSGGYPPFNYYDEKNELVGFDVDVSNEVAKRLGVEFRPVTTDWSGIIEGLRSGVYDGILGSMAVTDERKEKVDFSVPYYYSGAQLVVKENSPYKDPVDLKGKVIGVVTGTTFESDGEKLEAGEIKLYKDDNQTLMEVNSGVVDAVITDRVVGVNAINSGKFQIELLGNPLRSEDIAVAFRQSDDSLREAVDKILNEMHEDGTLKQLSEKWLQADITKK
ncbi:MAG: ABC transporter substrate-binding protein [Clostridiaceae bacterium BRH_c20a]|nr:MAG: ABC transporter substrate-binding protein [Clostridiaceae bacterium BRH_c20a]